ncbi:hypothetical protein BJX99DRAFT_38397 [Aspergillus californicus]
MSSRPVILTDIDAQTTYQAAERELESTGRLSMIVSDANTGKKVIKLLGDDVKIGSREYQFNLEHNRLIGYAREPLSTSMSLAFSSMIDEMVHAEFLEEDQKECALFHSGSKYHDFDPPNTGNIKTADLALCLDPSRRRRHSPQTCPLWVLEAEYINTAALERDVELWKAGTGHNVYLIVDAKFYKHADCRVSAHMTFHTSQGRVVRRELYPASLNRADDVIKFTREELFGDSQEIPLRADQKLSDEYFVDIGSFRCYIDPALSEQCLIPVKRSIRQNLAVPGLLTLLGMLFLLMLARE